MSEGTVTDKQVVDRRKIVSATTIVRNWNKIISEERTNHDLWPMKEPRAGVVLRYNIETLESFLEKPTWFLIYDLGFSLKDILVLLGSDFGKQPRRFPKNDWWIFFNKNHWTNQREKQNYYLLETVGIHRNKKWGEQEAEIVDSEQKLQRASTRLIMNLSIAYFLSKKSYLLEDCHHWGPELDFGMVRCASRFDEKGFALFNRGEWSPERRLGAFIVRKFDF